MACKNNKKNKRKEAFYRISKFDYEMRKNLTKEQSLPKETLTKENKKVESSSGNAWTEVWDIQINLRQKKAKINSKWQLTKTVS